MSWMTSPPHDRDPADVKWEIDLVERLGGIDQIRADGDERGRQAMAEYRAERDRRERLDFQRAHADHDSCSGPAVDHQPLYNRGCLGALLIPFAILSALFILGMRIYE